MKKRILFVFPNYASFVNKDISILSEDYLVDTFEFNAGKKWKTPYVFIKQFVFLLLHIGRYDVIICQLAAYHSFLPVLFAKLSGKPAVIFLGGTDCAKFPSINYGNFNKKILGLFTGWSVKLAGHLAPKHASLIDFAYNYDHHDFPFQGIRHFVKNFKTPFTVIENGYDIQKFRCMSEKKEKSFITVAAGIQLPNTVQLKGIDLILSVASLLPDCIFTIVGVPEGFQLKPKPSNVYFVSEVKNEELIELFSKHRYYLQLSMSEGFPNAICEAMLCECIPVGSNVNAIPEIIGDTGYVLMKRDSQLLFQLLLQALSKIDESKTMGLNARNRIAEHYTLDIRKKKLIALIEKLTDNRL